MFKPDFGKIKEKVTDLLPDLGGNHGPNTVFEIYVTTGNCVGSGTDANVSIILHGDNNEKSSVIILDKIPRDDFEKGAVDKFTIKTEKVQHARIIEIWRDGKGPAAKWFLDQIQVINRTTGEDITFPLRCWVQPNFRYKLIPYDSILPQDDSRKDQRRLGLDDKRGRYQLKEKIKGIPPRVISLPDEENFAFSYLWDLGEIAAKSTVAGKLNKNLKGEWKSFDDIKIAYTDKIYTTPTCIEHWKDDEHFGTKRLASLNPSLIKLCTKIPDKLGVTSAMVEPFLEGLSLSDALSNKRIFIVDLDIMKEAVTKSESFKVCSPIALFFVNQKESLKPIAIQLFQDKGPRNPVFLPSDPKNVWLFAKMWFNNADANLHESATHLGYTHLVMEGIAVSTHANLSVSHPVFKLLAPHFLYLLAINVSADATLISEDGWVDKVATVGRNGMLDLIGRMKKIWRMDVHGTLPADLKARGVDNPDVLPGYHFREDGLLLYNAIKTYVSKYIDLYYDSSERIIQDSELQSWADALATPADKGGCGILGVPGEGKFTNKEDIVTTVTSAIFTASVTHAAVNFPQYDEYAYPPNYPLQLSGEPPRSKTDLTEDDLVKSLPSKETTLDTMTITNILSTRATQALGDFEVQYIFDPKAMKIVEEFREELRVVGQKIDDANKKRRVPYSYLHPGEIPNAISI